MAKKAGKRIDGLLAETAQQQQQIVSLQQELDRLKPKKRQAFVIEDRTDINVVFADREAIRRDAADARHKRHKTTAEEKQQAAEAKVAQKIAKQAYKMLDLVQG